MASDDDTAPDPIGRDLLSTALSTMQPDQATITAHDTLASLFGNMGPLDPSAPVTAPPAIDPNQPGMGLPAPGRDAPPTLYAKIPPAELSPYTPPTADAISGAGPRVATPAADLGTPPPDEVAPRATVGLLDLPHPKTIAEAEQQQAMLAQSATNAALDAADAKAAAQHEHDLANQAALKKRNDDLAEADDLRARALEVGRQQAARDTAKLMLKLEKTIAEKPDPANYFSGDGGTQRRVGWIMAVAATAFANRRTGQANQALAMMEHTIDQDVALQKDQQALKIKQIGLERDDLKDRIKSDQLVIEDDYTHKIARLMSVAQLAQAKANAASNADLKAAHAGIVSWAQNEAVKVGAERTAHAATASEGDATRNHASAEARINQAFQERQATTAFNRAVVMKTIDAGFDAAKAAAAAKAKKDEDTTEVPIQSGLVVHDKDTGKTRAMSMTKEQYKLAGPMVAQYGQIADLYRRLDKHIKGMENPDRDIATGASLEFKADAQLLGSIMLKKMSGASAGDKEAMRIMEEMVGRVGGLTSIGGIGLSVLRGQTGQTKELIRRNLRNIGKEAAYDVATTYGGGNIGPNEELILNIQNHEAPETKPPTSDQQANLAGVKLSPRPSGVELAKLPPQVSFNMLEHADSSGSLPPLDAKAAAALDTFKTTLLQPKEGAEDPIAEGSVKPVQWLAKAGKKSLDLALESAPDKSQRDDVAGRGQIILQHAELLAKERSKTTIDDYLKAHPPGSTLDLGDLETWARRDGLDISAKNDPSLGWADLVEAATKALNKRDATIRGK